MKKKYEHLDVALYKKGITKKGVAQALGICERTLRAKINGESSFTWSEIKTIQSLYFPDVELDVLFQETKETDKVM